MIGSSVMNCKKRFKRGLITDPMESADMTI